MKTNKLKKLLAKLESSDDVFKGFTDFDDGVTALKAKLKNSIEVKTLDDVNSELNKFRKAIDIDPLMGAIDSLQNSFSEEVNSLISQINDRQEKITGILNTTGETTTGQVKDLQSAINDLGSHFEELTSEKNNDLKKLKDSINTSLSESINSLDDNVVNLGKDLANIKKDISKQTFSKDITSLEKDLAKAKQDLLNRINNIPRHGGGQANRNISVGGNSSVLSKYTDLNIKPGSNVTLTYSNNDTTKNLDLTIAATGSSGITRTIESTSVSSTVGAVATTDYVVLCTDGVKITLPTAVSNTNQYTIKNVAASSVLIATTGGETIDGDTTIIMPVQYTAVELISNNSNWQIT